MPKGTLFHSPSRPGTPVPSTHPLHPKHPISTPQQFHDWFEVISRAVAHRQEAHFRAHVATVSTRLELCENLRSSLDDVDADVASMLAQWTSVEEGGRSLKDACERLLDERACRFQTFSLIVSLLLQDRLIHVSDALSMRLEYFSELEHAMRMLNHPGEALVLQTDFLLMVERVDVCLEYMKSHVCDEKSLLRAYLGIASFQRGGDIYPSLFSMLDTCNDSDQDVLYWFTQGAHGRHPETRRGKSKPVLLGAKV